MAGKFPKSALTNQPCGIGAFDEAGNLWNIEGNRISLRLPWTYLNVSDPSSLRVLQDSRTGYFNGDRDALKTTVTDGFIVDSIVWDRERSRTSGGIAIDPAKPFIWEGWEIAPPYREKLKKSYYILKDTWAADALGEKGLR